MSGGLRIMGNRVDYSIDSLFKATNPTIATGITQGILAAHDPLKALLSLRNNNAVGGKDIIPLWLKLINTVAPASSTRFELVAATDTYSRYSSGGTAITPVAAYKDQANTTGAVIHFGALVLTAAVSQRILNRRCIFGGIPVVNSEFILTFGQNLENSGANALTGVQRIISDLGNCVIAPQSGLYLQPWYPSNATTGASYEFELGYVEQ